MTVDELIAELSALPADVRSGPAMLSGEDDKYEIVRVDVVRRSEWSADDVAVLYQ